MSKEDNIFYVSICKNDNQISMLRVMSGNDLELTHHKKKNYDDGILRHLLHHSLYQDLIVIFVYAYRKNIFLSKYSQISQNFVTHKGYFLWF